MPPNIFDTEVVLDSAKEGRRSESLLVDLERASVVEIPSLALEASFLFDNPLWMEYESFEEVLSDEEQREEKASSTWVVNPERSRLIGVKAGE